jgi:hypothetical protein
MRLPTGIRRAKSLERGNAYEIVTQITAISGSVVTDMVRDVGGRMVNGWDDPDCAERLRGKLANAIASMLRLGINHSDEARIQWQGAAQKYRDRWAQGDLDAIGPVLSDLLAWLRRMGIDPSGNAEVVALFSDPVLANFQRRIAALDTHSRFLETFRQLAGTRER